MQDTLLQKFSLNQTVYFVIDSSGLFLKIGEGTITAIRLLKDLKVEYTISNVKVIPDEDTILLDEYTIYRRETDSLYTEIHECRAFVS